MRVPGRSAGCPSPSQPRVSRERAVRAVSGAQGPRGQRLGVRTQAACSQAAVCRPLVTHPCPSAGAHRPLSTSDLLLTFIVSLLICPPPPMYLPPGADTSTRRNAQLWALSLGLTFPKPPAWGGRGGRRQKHRGVLAKLGGPGEPARRPRSPSARLRSPAGRLPLALVWGGWRAERPQGGPAHRPRDLGSPGLLTPAPPHPTLAPPLLEAQTPSEPCHVHPKPRPKPRASRSPATVPPPSQVPLSPKPGPYWGLAPPREAPPTPGQAPPPSQAPPRPRPSPHREGPPRPKPRPTQGSTGAGSHSLRPTGGGRGFSSWACR